MQPIERRGLVEVGFPRSASLRWALASLLPLLIFVFVVPSLEAASCGGTKPCKCGMPTMVVKFSPMVVIAV